MILSPSILHPAQLYHRVSAHPSVLLSSCFSCQSRITARWVLHPATALQKNSAATLVSVGVCRNSKMTARSKKSKFKQKGCDPFLSALKPRLPLTWAQRRQEWAFYRVINAEVLCSVLHEEMTWHLPFCMSCMNFITWGRPDRHNKYV